MIRGKSKIGGSEGGFAPDILNLSPLKGIDVSDFLRPVQSSSLFFLSPTSLMFYALKRLLMIIYYGLPSIALQRQLLLQWFQDKL